MSASVLSTRHKTTKTNKKNRQNSLTSWSLHSGAGTQTTNKIENGMQKVPGDAVGLGCGLELQAEDRGAALVCRSPGAQERVMAPGPAGHAGLSSRKGTILLLSTRIRTLGDPQLSM